MNGRYVTSKTAARKLGVDRELIERLVRARKIDGRFDAGRSGNIVCLVSLEDAKRLARIALERRVALAARLSQPGVQSRQARD